MSDELFTIPFYSYSQGVFERLRTQIQGMSSGRFENTDELINGLATGCRLTELDIDWDSLRVLPSPREEESSYTDAFGDRLRTVTPVYTFEVKYSGSSALLSIGPSSSRLIRLEADILDDKFRFEIKGSDKSRLEQIKEGIKFNVESQRKEVGSFNGELETTIRVAVERRKQQLGEHDQGLNAFGVPVKESDG